MTEVDFKIMTKRKQYLKMSFGPRKKKKSFVMEQQLSEKKKRNIHLHKPIHIETIIFDLSKVLMLDFHYNCIKNKYCDKAEMLPTN